MDMSKTARNKRYNEFIALRSLPFLSPAQNRKLVRLSKQRKIDNYYAFQCAKVK